MAALTALMLLFLAIEAITPYVGDEEDEEED